MSAAAHEADPACASELGNERCVRHGQAEAMAHLDAGATGGKGNGSRVTQLPARPVDTVGMLKQKFVARAIAALAARVPLDDAAELVAAPIGPSASLWTSAPLVALADDLSATVALALGWDAAFPIVLGLRDAANGCALAGQRFVVSSQEGR
jgi:hypothetical protein